MKITYTDIITKIVQKNFSDLDELSKIEKTQTTIDELNQFIDYFTLDFTEWVLDNYDKLDNISYKRKNDPVSELYNIEDLLVIFKK